ncbi:hemolysin family protein [Parageobacillus toebii]|uniref:hemolysin family protein n=1 Tax=Parageobacillus toebii TaxID=153151 RepID=UPI002E1F1ECE|nr:hemolysin family protein [Parageobacillus toebii]
MEIVNLLMVGVLIALTAFFVASEFAIVKVRSTRIDQLIAEGNRNARAAKRVISNLDEYLSACQLGITITALGLGWLGEPTVEHLLHPVFERMNLSESVASFLSFAIAFATITFLHVVVGELAPKTLAIQKAETITLLSSRPLIFFYKMMYPFIWALNGSARVITGLFGLKPASEHEVAHSEEELRLILSESYKRGEINQSEYKYVNNIFEFDDRIAKEVMVPRTEIVALDKNRSIAEYFETIKQEKYTRYPVIDGDKDHIVGMVNIKEILTDCIQNPKATEKKLGDYIRPIIQVIESIPIHDLLVKMQRERVHMAILVDEYGGTAGLVTVEDILEEIVGEIQDEFDIDEVPMIRKVNEHTTIVDGKVLIEDVNDLLGTDIDDTDVDTIGGWILTEKFDIQQGGIISYGDYEFKVLKMEGHHVQLVEITKRVKAPSLIVQEAAIE